MTRLKASTLMLVAIVFFSAICPSAEGQERKYALKGTIVTPDQVLENAFILIAGSKIRDVGAKVNIPADTQIVEVDGIVLPGFVDLHNHLTWNLLPRWRPNKEFANRYEWQQLPLYDIALATPHAQLIKMNLGCAMNRYAEVKAITQGETSVVGSLAPPQQCVEGFARNLDSYSDFGPPGKLGQPGLRYEVFPLELDTSTVTQINDALANGSLASFIVHLAEGKPTDASSAREFKMFAARGFLRPGVSIVHGIALKQAEFRAMADKRVGLIWSPRSNLELYGATTDVSAALRERVKLSLSPDWSPTGSNGMLEELKFAATWNGGQVPMVFTNKELVRMTTEYPAQMAGLGDKIGTLAAGFYADLVVLKRTQKDAYDAIVHASPADIELVIIGGEPIYGSPEIMRKLVPQRPLEVVTLCGSEKVINYDSEPTSAELPRTWKQTISDLTSALGDWGSSIAPLADCPN